MSDKHYPHKRIDACDGVHECKQCVYYLTCMAHTPEGDRWPCFVPEADCHFTQNPKLETPKAVVR